MCELFYFVVFRSFSVSVIPYQVFPPHSPLLISLAFAYIEDNAWFRYGGGFLV